MNQNIAVQQAPRDRGQATERMTASYMTHELRAPLTSIRLTLEILQEQLEGRLQPDEKQILIIALRNAGRLAGLVNDILDYTKTQAGKLAVNAAAAGPFGLVKDAVDALRAWSVSKGVRLFCSGEGELLPEVMADAKRVVQVLINLISNSIKFTPAGGSVEVSAVPGRDENEGSLIFSVKDSGCGIAAGEFERIFRCFEQSASGVKSGEGTGLGLALAKSMVEAHGGRIWVESLKGVGSTFYFTLPLSVSAGVKTLWA